MSHSPLKKWKPSPEREAFETARARARARAQAQSQARPEPIDSLFTKEKPTTAQISTSGWHELEPERETRLQFCLVRNQRHCLEWPYLGRVDPEAYSSFLRTLGTVFARPTPNDQRFVFDWLLLCRSLDLGSLRHTRHLSHFPGVWIWRPGDDAPPNGIAQSRSVGEQICARYHISPEDRTDLSRRFEPTQRSVSESGINSLPGSRRSKNNNHREHRERTLPW